MKNVNRIELTALTPTPDGYYFHTYNPQNGMAGGIQTTITTKKRVIEMLRARGICCPHYAYRGK